MLNISLTIDIPSSYGKQQQDKNVIYNDRMLNPSYFNGKIENYRSLIDLKW